MYRKSILSLATTILLLIVVFAPLLGCSDVGDENVTERLRFTEFFLFPTAPYVNKSYREHVPDEDIAIREVNLELEIAEIQKVYRDFINAYAAEDMSALTRTLDTATSMEWEIPAHGRTSHSWSNARSVQRALWHTMIAPPCRAIPDWEKWKLTDFYIRGAYIKRPWMEASAKGPMFFPNGLSEGCISQLASFYLTKRPRGLSGKRDRWQIHQINGSRYFTDPKYRVEVP